ncbi:hypothetical protein LP316_13640 [Thalassotalea sp. LPB0316]|uniref:hypothetical protein n=1 Tax=Thalassotalea sp. LPB0316 TaxID=2769490 RepID=UPI001867359F|nr:hypothetical protein [Thalassotalea sp. LPB0316]QOL25325.1 hypothetical protein LP316_13640 [Thalassotalea sp. LPB0316]
MKKLLTAPVQMNLSESQNQYYQQILQHIAQLSLNFMAVKVHTYPEKFLDWCIELHRICQQDLNLALLDDHQFKPLKKIEDTLVQAISVDQIKLSRVMPWPVFAAFIDQNSQRHGLAERIALLDYLQTKKDIAFDQLIEEDKLALIGKHSAKHDPSIYPFDVEWFASTKAAKPFISLVNTQPQAIAQLLATIPATGEVSEQAYFDFVEQYIALFTKYLPNEKIAFMPATRLLAMLRPDQFVALTNAKVDMICQGLGVSKIRSQAPLAFIDYWHEIISTIRTSPWYNQALPEASNEQAIWPYRVALLDMFLFVEEDHASKSNYLKLRDKPAKTSNKTTAVKRTKASAEQLVDHALQDESTPEFIKGMRDSIIKSVQAGKSVDDSINLMKAIFS